MPVAIKTPAVIRNFMKSISIPVENTTGANTMNHLIDGCLRNIGTRVASGWRCRILVGAMTATSGTSVKKSDLQQDCPPPFIPIALPE